jgi:hypothetical protein
MGFFDFLNDTTRYGGKSLSINRLERRREWPQGDGLIWPHL